jgi:hypothetical protein
VPDRTSVTTDASGRRVLAKVARTSDEAARLVLEAASLDAGRHPGVAELVGVDGHGLGAVLLTAHVDGPALAQVGSLPLEEAAGLLAALCCILADLHELGLVHGAVCPDHVVLGPGGRPVLCSLGYGGRIGAPAGAAPALGQAFTDPGRAGAEALDPAFDVFGLGALARFLAPDPPPGHVLGRVASEATAEDLSARPPARHLADALTRDVPAARLPRGRPASTPPGVPLPRPPDPLDAWRRERAGSASGRAPARRRPVAAMAVAGLAVAGLAAGAAVLAGHRPVRPPGPAAEVAGPAPGDASPPALDVRSGPTTTRVGPASSSTTPATSPARRDCPAATGLLQADVDGDGCAESLRYADGILDAGPVRWSLGRPGDQLAAGDWGCQGARTLALFRPSTGEVFRFDGWAATGHDVSASAVAVVAGGEALRAADVDHDGCHELVVERATGAAEVVRLPGPRP